VFWAVYIALQAATTRHRRLTRRRSKNKDHSTCLPRPPQTSAFLSIRPSDHLASPTSLRAHPTFLISHQPIHLSRCWHTQPSDPVSHLRPRSLNLSCWQLFRLGEMALKYSRSAIIYTRRLFLYLSLLPLYRCWMRAGTDTVLQQLLLPLTQNALLVPATRLDATSNFQPQSCRGSSRLAKRGAKGACKDLNTLANNRPNCSCYHDQCRCRRADSVVYSGS
jgi:hypothetical protein